jgi:hypothetical protein
MWNIIKLKNPVWYIDATGGVHQKINGQKEIFIYRTVCHDENQKKIIPVFDFLTTCHTGENLAKYLRYAVARIEQNFSKNSPLIVPPIIVMDFSYAIVNSILESINKCSLTEYLSYCSNVLVKENELLSKQTHIYLCSTHF